MNSIFSESFNYDTLKHSIKQKHRAKTDSSADDGFKLDLTNRYKTLSYTDAHVNFTVSFEALVLYSDYIKMLDKNEIIS